MTEEIYFRIGHGLEEIIRQAYWYENRQEWANETLDCFHGITETQKQAILNGDAKLVPTEDGREVTILYETDKDFKEKLTKHLKWREENFYNLAGKYVNKDLVDKYIEFVVSRYRLSIHRPNLFVGHPLFVMRMEEIRVALHDMILESAGFKGDRKTFKKSVEYLKVETTLSDMLDEEAGKWKDFYESQADVDVKQFMEKIKKKYPLMFEEKDVFEEED